MEELDLLKQDWKKQEKNIPQLSYEQIYKMLWKKSSSIVKWIFVISILELLGSTLLNIFLADEAYWRDMEKLHLKNFLIGLYFFSYSVTFVFIYLFYKNYQRISTTDNAATLMKNIIKTRKTVKTYIAYVLISSFVIWVVVIYFTITNHKYLEEVENVSTYEFGVAEWAGFIIATTLIMGILLGLIWLFYRLIYGILLKRLYRNYKELKKLEF